MEGYIYLVYSSTFFVLLFAVSTVYAHPPSDIKITFDPEIKILQAVIIHNTSNPIYK
ncbi:MAG: hypothetical protein NC908_03855 [Candidatus Omnitrophica bacterium]|nr:hypothetical protein [Candidatus Omnitrophota bacterium]